MAIDHVLVELGALDDLFGVALRGRGVAPAGSVERAVAVLQETLRLDVAAVDRTGLYGWPLGDHVEATEPRHAAVLRLTRARRMLLSVVAQLAPLFERVGDSRIRRVDEWATALRRDLNDRGLADRVLRWSEADIDEAGALFRALLVVNVDIVGAQRGLAELDAAEVSARSAVAGAEGPWGPVTEALRLEEARTDLPGALRELAEAATAILTSPAWGPEDARRPVVPSPVPDVETASAYLTGALRGLRTPERFELRDVIAVVETVLVHNAGVPFRTEQVRRARRAFVAVLLALVPDGALDPDERGAFLRRRLDGLEPLLRDVVRGVEVEHGRIHVLAARIRDVLVLNVDGVGRQPALADLDATALAGWPDVPEVRLERARAGCFNALAGLARAAAGATEQAATERGAADDAS